MEHIGIDLGGRESQICVRSVSGQILEEHRIPTNSLGRYLRARPVSRVVMETCAEAFAVADGALQAGHEVRVVPATLVRSLGVGARGIKTDIRDARVQSEASCRIDLPSVHIPSVGARELKTMLNMRQVLVASRTQLVNSVRGYLRGQLVRVRSTTKTFPTRVREQLLESHVGLSAYVERQLRAIEALTEQIEAADAELEERTQKDDRCRLLMTVPGVGPVTSARFVSTLDDVTRFPNAKSVASYLGMTPGENSSSDRQRRTGLTKAGPSAARHSLIQAAWTLWRTRPHDGIRHWAWQISQRRGKNMAVCALARKMAGILYAMWRDGRPYDPKLISTM